MKSAILTLVASVGIFDLAFSSGTLAPVAFLYVFVQAQADMAAARFLRDGIQCPEKVEAPIDPVLAELQSAPQKPQEATVIPFPKQKRKESKKAPPKESAAKEKTKENQTRAKETRQEKTKPFFQLPKFTGAPHEVLGIQENSATQLILQAFRHWIKLYHPDRNQAPSQARLTTEKARQITTAKAQLLEKRKRMREQGAA